MTVLQAQLQDPMWQHLVTPIPKRMMTLRGWINPYKHCLRTNPPIMFNRHRIKQRILSPRYHLKPLKAKSQYQDNYYRWIRHKSPEGFLDGEVGI